MVWTNSGTNLFGDIAIFKVCPVSFFENNIVYYVRSWRFGSRISPLSMLSKSQAWIRKVWSVRLFPMELSPPLLMNAPWNSFEILNNYFSQKFSTTIFHRNSQQLFFKKLPTTIFHRNSQQLFFTEISTTIFHRNNNYFSQKLPTTIFHRNSQQLFFTETPNNYSSQSNSIPTKISTITCVHGMLRHLITWRKKLVCERGKIQICTQKELCDHIQRLSVLFQNNEIDTH